MCLDKKTKDAINNGAKALIVTIVVGSILWLISSISPPGLTVEAWATVFVGIGVLFLVNKKKQ